MPKAFRKPKSLDAAVRRLRWSERMLDMDRENLKGRTQLSTEENRKYNLVLRANIQYTYEIQRLKSEIERLKSEIERLKIEQERQRLRSLAGYKEQEAEYAKKDFELAGLRSEIFNREHPIGENPLMTAENVSAIEATTDLIKTAEGK